MITKNNIVWTFHSAKKSFHEFRTLWDSVNAIQGNHVLRDGLFVESLINCFADDHTLLGVCQGSGFPTLGLFTPGRAGFWATFQPSQAPIGFLLVGEPETFREQIGGLFSAFPRYALGLSILHQDPDFTRADGDLAVFGAERVDHITTSRIRIQGNFDEYWTSRGRFYSSDLRRQCRRLAERGVEFELRVERKPDRMAECVAEYARLEESGWKNKEGTAVTQTNSQGQFYRDVLQKFASQEEAVVYQLLFNGKTVASNLCLQRNGMLVILKIAYDESYEGISPGKLLNQEMFRHLFTEGSAQVLEWYGRLHEWQVKLGAEPRTIFHLNLYRHPWIARLRRIAKRLVPN